MVESPVGQPVDMVFNINAVVVAFLILVPLERVFGLHAEHEVLPRAFTGDVVYAPFAQRSFLNALFRMPARSDIDPVEGHYVRVIQRFISAVKSR